MKTREFIRKHLRPIGAKLLKKDGTHHVYELPNGQKMVVPMGGADHSEAGSYLVRRLNKLMKVPAGESRRTYKEEP